MREIKKINFHGILSIIIFITAIGIASINIFFYSRLFGIIYLSIIPVLFLSVIYFYCRKCPHVKSESCRHFIFGKIAKIFQNRADEKYNIVDYIGTIIPILGIVAFPQFWLIKNIPLFVTFIILLIIAGIEVTFFVCPDCSNTNCLNCKQQIKIKR